MIVSTNVSLRIGSCSWCGRLFRDYGRRPEGYCSRYCRQRHQQSIEQDAAQDWFAVLLRQEIIRSSWPPGEEPQRRFSSQIVGEAVEEMLEWTVPTASVPPDDAREADG